MGRDLQGNQANRNSGSSDVSLVLFENHQRQCYLAVSVERSNKRKKQMTVKMPSEIIPSLYSTEIPTCARK